MVDCARRRLPLPESSAGRMVVSPIVMVWAETNAKLKAKSVKLRNRCLATDILVFHRFRLAIDIFCWFAIMIRITKGGGS